MWDHANAKKIKNLQGLLHISEEEISVKETTGCLFLVIQVISELKILQNVFIGWFINKKGIVFFSFTPADVS